MWKKSVLVFATLCTLSGLNCSTVDSAIDYEGATITIVVQGGFAGIYDKLVVEPCGTATRYVRIGYPYEYRVQTRRLSQSEHSLLLSDFEGFFLLKDSYLPERPCMDCFEYWITYSTPTRSKTVYTADGSGGEQPEQLQTIVKDFWSIMAEFPPLSN